MNELTWIERNEKAMLGSYTEEDKELARDWKTCALHAVFDLPYLGRVKTQNIAKYLKDRIGPEAKQLGIDFMVAVERDQPTVAEFIYSKMEEIRDE